jgi:hypothetical protein
MELPLTPAYITIIMHYKQLNISFQLYPDENNTFAGIMLHDHSYAWPNNNFGPPRRETQSWD